MTEPPPGLSVESLLVEATSRASLDDWGDQGFVRTLELLVESCRQTAALNALGWDVLHKVLLRHLRNRLYLQAHLTSHPDAVVPVEAPVVITGLPRTGTTLLHNLLALDPANRVLRFWEALHPLPPDPARGTSEEALAAKAEVWLERLYALAPGFRAIHGATARGPEECDALLQNSFASQHFDDMFAATAYSAWLSHASLADEYAYYAVQLGVLSGPPPGVARQWVLKSPSHLGYLDTLLATFPHAVVVHCHRHPVEAIGSYASLVEAVRGPYTDSLALADVGAHAIERCEVATRRALKVREGAGPAPFVDVGYRDLVADPLAMVRRLYVHLGRELEPSTTASMATWLADNPQHKHGRHRYTLERFGLSPEVVLKGLGDYADRFPV
ncbi:MAG: sulfotransferase family protein [Acidimicrobiales bacterium]